MKTVYDLVIDNGNYSATLGTFDTEKEAEMAGKNWQLEMSGIDPEGAEEYCYEVIETEEYTEDEKLEAECAEEQSLGYFDRYIAGDR